MTDSGENIVGRETFEVTADDGVKIFGSEKYVAGMDIKGTVLLLHPMNALGHIYWDIPMEGYNFMDYLARRGFRAIGMDFRGYGDSEKPEWVTWEGCSKDIEAVVTHIKNKYGISKLHVVATSFGATSVAYFLGNNQDSIDRLVMSGYMYKQMPGGPIADRMKELIDKGKHYVHEKPSLEPGPELYDAEPELMAVWSGLTKEKNPTRPITHFLDPEGREKAASHIPLIKVPTLFIRGDHDLNKQDDNLQSFKDCGAQEKAFMEVGNIGHSLWRDKMHMVVYRAIIGWLSD